MTTRRIYWQTPWLGNYLLVSVFYWLFASPSAGYAQTSPVLESYIETGLSSNYMLKQQDLDIQKAMEAVRQANALFRPSLNFEANYTLAAGGRRIDFPIGDLLNPVYGTLNQLTQSNSFPAVENAQINFLPNNFQETKLKFAYPIYNTDIRYNRRIKELLVQSKAAQRAAFEQTLRYDIALAYLQYLQAIEAEKIWQNAKITLSELRRFNAALVKNNVATRDVVASADYEISKVEHEIYQVQNLQNSARAYFNFLLNKDLQSDVEIDSNLLKSAVPSYERNALIEMALGNRQEFEALRIGKDAAATAVSLEEANRKIPDFYLGGETGFQGFGYDFTDNQAYILAQVGLKYEIYDAGIRKSKVQEARIETEKLQVQSEQLRQQVALQVTQAYNDWMTAQNKYRSTQSGLESIETSYQIINNKYRAGQALLLEYTDAQNKVTQLRIEALLAKIDILTKQSALRQAVPGL